MQGKLIVIEGTDGSGKATQFELAIKYLRDQGKEAEVFDFPQYGKKSAGPVEEYLSGKYGGLHDVPAKTASLLYAVDRFDASFKIRAALKAGKIVLANRYVLSNAAHQGAKLADPSERQKFLRWLYELEYGILKLPRPDLIIFLHVPAEIGYQLVLKKAKRPHLQGKAQDIHEADLDYLKAVEAVYRELAASDSAVKTIECAPEGVLLGIEDIHNRVLKTINPVRKGLDFNQATIP